LGYFRLVARRIQGAVGGGCPRRRGPRLSRPARFHPDRPRRDQVRL